MLFGNSEYFWNKLNTNRIDSYLYIQLQINICQIFGFLTFLFVLSFQLIHDEKVLKYIDGIATHWYDDATVSHEVINLARTDKKDLFLLASESCKYLQVNHLI